MSKRKNRLPSEWKEVVLCFIFKFIVHFKITFLFKLQNTFYSLLIFRDEYMHIHTYHFV